MKIYISSVASFPSPRLPGSGPAVSAGAGPGLCKTEPPAEGGRVGGLCQLGRRGATPDSGRAPPAISAPASVLLRRLVNRDVSPAGDSRRSVGGFVGGIEDVDCQRELGFGVHAWAL